MSSQENLVQEDVLQTTNTDNKEPSDEVKDVEAKLSSDNQSKESDETTGSLSSKATIETSTNGAVKSTGAIVELTNGISGNKLQILVDLFNQIRKKFVIFVHFKGFNISQKPKSSPLSYFAQKTSLNLAPKSDNFYVFVPE
jgi:hypothetical protein